MATIRKTITLTDAQDEWIKARIASGEYTNDSEYIRDLARRDREQHAKYLALNEAIRKGLDSGVSERTARSGRRPSDGIGNGMGEFRFSRRAIADLAEIANYTIENFGIEQARRYPERLEFCFQNLADAPNLDRSAEQVASGLRRYEYHSHVIFYMPQGSVVLIVRVLHQSMDVERHL